MFLCLTLRKCLRIWGGSILVLCQLSGCHSLPPEPNFSGGLIAEQESDGWSSPGEVQVLEKRETLNPAYPAHFQTLVSLSIVPGTPLKSVLVELSRQANVNLALGQGVDGQVHFTSQKRPFIEVIEQLTALAGLRFFVKAETLFIEKDTPYTHVYNIQFLTLNRQSQSRMTSSTDLMETTPQGRGTVENGAQNTILGTTTVDFWGELSENLSHILQNEAGVGASFSGGEPDDGGTFTFHKQGGMVTVTGTQRQHRTVEGYLDRLKKTISSQVLIEAKIIEVSLKKEFQNGIQWNAFQGKIGTEGSLKGSLASLKDVVSFYVTGRKISSMLTWLDRFGKTRTLSSPRLTVLNNQAAVLKVAENDVYFKIRYDRLTRNKDQGGDVVNASTDIHTVPLGLILTVQPSIDTETNTVTLALRPTITSSSRSKSDPAVEIESQQKVESLIPIVQVREIDSILHLLNKEVVVLGGLMQEVESHSSSGVPGSRQVPFLGRLLRSDADNRQVVELVILLRATILPSKI